MNLLQLYTLIGVLFPHLIFANTDIWKFYPNDIIIITNNQDDNNNNNISSLQIYNKSLQNNQINTIKVDPSQLNLLIPLNQSISSSSSLQPYNFHYFKVSWSAIDPILSFNNVHLIQINNILYFQINIILDPQLKPWDWYGDDDDNKTSLLINIYLDSSTNKIPLTKDLYGIITYITLLILFLTIIFWNLCGKFDTILHNYLF